MAFHITHSFGSMDGGQSVFDFPELLAELQTMREDSEHSSVSVTHESEWCMSVFFGGYVIFEHLEVGGERHMRDVNDAQVLQLWTLLANGEIDAVKNAPWLPGY